MAACRRVFSRRDPNIAHRISAAQRFALGAILCAFFASPAQSQMLGVRAAAVARTPKSVIANAVQEASRRFKIPASWLHAVMQAESHGDANSVSEKGAIGLMQVMPQTYAELRAKHGFGPDPFDPCDNILAGAAYLAEMFDRYGAPGFLAAYNAGPGRYDKLLFHGHPLPAETTDYVARLTPELGMTRAPPPQIHDRSDSPGAPIFFTASALKIASEARIDGATKASEPPKSGAAHPLFPAWSHDKIFASETRLDGRSKASSGAVPVQTSGLFVARAALESTP